MPPFFPHSKTFLWISPSRSQKISVENDGVESSRHRHHDHATISSTTLPPRPNRRLGQSRVRATQAVVGARQCFQWRNRLRQAEILDDVVARMRRNSAYFRMNYAFLLLLLVLCSFLKEPVSLLVIVAVTAAWCLLYLFRSELLVVLNRSLSDGALLACLTVVTILALFLTGVTGTILTAVAVGALIVALHGAFRVSDDLFLDEEEATHNGLVGHTYTAIPSNPRHV